MNASRPTSWWICLFNYCSNNKDQFIKCTTKSHLEGKVHYTNRSTQWDQSLFTHSGDLPALSHRGGHTDLCNAVIKKKQASYSIKYTRLHREETLPLSASVTIWITYEQWSSAEQIFNFLSYLFTQLCNRYSYHLDKDNRSDLCIPALLPKNYWDLQEMWMHKLPLWKKRCFIIYDFILTDGNHKYASSTSCQSC